LQLGLKITLIVFGFVLVDAALSPYSVFLYSLTRRRLV
jgi:hypothetical protein